MVRGKIWFRCAVVHDPVTPMVVQPALIGWEAKQRNIDLVIERAFKGDELVRRMKGWITVETEKVIDTVNKYGRLRVIDDRELIVETANENDFNSLQKEISEVFNGQVDLDLISISPK
jgi:hypothetical protein